MLLFLVHALAEAPFEYKEARGPVSLITAPMPIHYQPSYYDPLVGENKDLYYKKGFMVNHRDDRKYNDKIAFGSLMIITLNIRLVRDTKLSMQKQELFALIDTHHPTILVLQDVSIEILKYLENELGKKGHYGISNGREELKSIDADTGETLYNITIYDKNLLQVANENTWPTRDKHQVFATQTVFIDLASKQQFVVVNWNLFSSDAKTTTLQMNKIMKDLVKSGHIKLPVFFAGTVNVYDKGTKRFMRKTLRNTLYSDSRNNTLRKDTFHGRNFMTGEEKDFIEISKNTSRYKINYARILTKFNSEAFERYPVMAIFELRKSKSRKSKKSRRRR
ncbi:hypothetical protein ENBRE01_2722 [Enteropsectra breve]|nr:hypothetical protein ENBRE01_2722 [Enteropsectra breve]